MASSSATAGTSNNIDFDEEAKNRQYRLDQMLEAKMISDILRANNNLKALKAFRVQNEASYKEKELVLVRNQEIREPLEAAIFQNDVMAGKLERREDMIRDLRRDLLLETIKSKLGSLDRTQSNRGPQLDQKDADELKQLSLQDQIAELNIIIHYNQNELKKCKRVIEIQFKKIKSLRDELEQSEYAFNERIKRIDSDKEIYLGMIESRENKIEKLMEDLDEVNEELSSTAEELEKAKLDKKNAQKLMEEYKVQAVNATSLQEVAEKKAFELDRELKIIREEHFELSEKYTDIQLRYEGLVEELDRMVLEGYYIPEVKVSTTAPTKKEKARKNKTVKVQDVQKVSKKFPKMKGSAVAASNDDGATIISDPSTSQLAEMTAVPSVVPSSSSAHFAAMPAVELSGGVEGASTVIARIPSTVGDRPSSVSGERRASSFINTVPEGKSSTASINGIRPDVPEAPDNTAMEDCDDDDEEDGGDDDNKSTESEVVPRMGRFSMRKMQEDVLLQEKLAVHAATRMKEALQQQISALEAELQTEKQNRKADQDQAMAMREGLQMNQKVLAAEISRLTSKISEQEKSIASLNDELQIAQAASKFSGLVSYRVRVFSFCLDLSLSHVLVGCVHPGFVFHVLEAKRIADAAIEHPHYSLLYFTVRQGER